MTGYKRSEETAIAIEELRKKEAEKITSKCDKVKIVGYVEQTSEQIDYINRLKTSEIDIVKVLDLLRHCSDPRWISIAKTHIQTGFMAAVRAIARPMGD